MLVVKGLSPFTDKVSNACVLLALGQHLKFNDCALAKNKYTLSICRKRVETQNKEAKCFDIQTPSITKKAWHKTQQVKRDELVGRALPLGIAAGLANTRKDFGFRSNSQGASKCHEDI